jgi:hypothetical protein
MAFEYTTGCEHGRADERRRIATAMRRKARAHERLAGLRANPRAWWHSPPFARYHEGAADALTEMAERIERGEP